MATLAFGEVVRIAAVNLDITGGAQGLVGIPNKTTTLHNIRRARGHNLFSGGPWRVEDRLESCQHSGG